MDEDGAALGIDALLVEVGGDAIVVLRLIGVHLLALALVLGLGGVDNLVVVFAVVVTGESSGLHVDVRHRGAGVWLDAKGAQWTEGACWSLGVSLTRLAKAVLTNPHVGRKQHLAVDRQTGRSRTALHVVHFEQLSVLLGDYIIVNVART